MGGQRFCPTSPIIPLPLRLAPRRLYAPVPFVRLYILSVRSGLEVVPCSSPQVLERMVVVRLPDGRLAVVPEASPRPVVPFPVDALEAVLEGEWSPPGVSVERLGDGVRLEAGGVSVTATALSGEGSVYLGKYEDGGVVPAAPPWWWPGSSFSAVVAGGLRAVVKLARILSSAPVREKPRQSLVYAVSAVVGPPGFGPLRLPAPRGELYAAVLDGDRAPARRRLVQAGRSGVGLAVYASRMAGGRVEAYAAPTGRPGGVTVAAEAFAALAEARGDPARAAALLASGWRPEPGFEAEWRGLHYRDSGPVAGPVVVGVGGAPPFPVRVVLPMRLVELRVMSGEVWRALLRLLEKAAGSPARLAAEV